MPNTLPLNDPFRMMSLTKHTYLLLLALSLMIAFFGKAIAADFVGAQACIGCHEKAYQDWQGSHHDMSMKHANNESVLGNFDNSKLVAKNKAEKASTFFKRGLQFWVNIKGEDGKFHDYQIKYTFGYTPLQQYMVEF